MASIGVESCSGEGDHANRPCNGENHDGEGGDCFRPVGNHQQQSSKGGDSKPHHPTAVGSLRTVADAGHGPPPSPNGASPSNAAMAITVTFATVMARYHDGQLAPPEASATFWRPAEIHGIMPRNLAPTTSIGCALPSSWRRW